jgi:hypothetical protein
LPATHAQQEGKHLNGDAQCNRTSGARDDGESPMTIDIVETVSVPGSPINEDRAGHARFPSGTSAAWVIDGATGLADREAIPDGPTDAAWLAERFSLLLAEDDPASLPAVGYFERLLGRVAALYDTAVPDWKRLPPWALPSAACMWLRAVGPTLELAWQGDCVAVVERDGSVVLAGAEEARLWEDDINAVVRARLAALPSAQTPIMLEILDELRHRRARLNQPGGYWMLGIDPRAAAAMDVRTIAIDGRVRVLLASDGLWRLVDHFQCYDPVGLLDEAFRTGLAPLVGALRKLEDDDADCRRVPRVKPRDDATGLTLIASPG